MVCVNVLDTLTTNTISVSVYSLSGPSVFVIVDERLPSRIRSTQVSSIIHSLIPVSREYPHSQIVPSHIRRSFAIPSQV